MNSRQVDSQPEQVPANVKNLLSLRCSLQRKPSERPQAILCVWTPSFSPQKEWEMENCAVLEFSYKATKSWKSHTSIG